MNIIVHYNKSAIEVSSAADGRVGDRDSWAKLTQQIVEQSFMHPPQLLILLASLSASSSSNNHSYDPIESKSRDFDRYLFRFGDGYATMIQTIWGKAGRSNRRVIHNTVGGGDKGEREMIEANITLNPRAGRVTRNNSSSKLLQQQCHPSAMIPIPKQNSDDGEGEGGSSGAIHVDLIVEMVGFAEAQQQKHHQRNRRRRGNRDSRGDGSGDTTTFPMTQTPFPIDDNKMNLFSVWEHPTFKGVVDHFTLEQYSLVSANSRFTAVGAEGYGLGEGGGTLHSNNNVAELATIVAEAPSSAALLETTTEPNSPSNHKMMTRKKLSLEQETDTPSSIKRVQNASQRPLNGFIVFRDEIRSILLARHPGISITKLAKLVGKEYRALSDDRRRRYIEDARLSITRYDEEILESTSSASKKSKSKMEEDESYSEEESSVVSTTPSSPSDIDYTNDEEEFEEELDDGNAGRSVDSDIGENRQKNKPKRPLNGYFLFACEIRDQVRAANPHLTGSKIMCKIAEAYNALDSNAKKWYEATGRNAFAKYKEEFGKDVMKLGPRYKGKVVGKEQKKQFGIVSDESTVETSVSDRRRYRDIVSDVPASPADGLPTGWTMRVIRRSGTSNWVKHDKYWYSPVQSYRFLSMTKIEQFLERLEEVGGDEVMAYKLCKLNDRKRKNTDAADIVVYDRKKAKRSKRASRKKKIVVELDEDADVNESEEDEMNDDRSQGITVYAV